jgi:hypothetical protein
MKSTTAASFAENVLVENKYDVFLGSGIDVDDGGKFIYVHCGEGNIAIQEKGFSHYVRRVALRMSGG